MAKIDDGELILEIEGATDEQLHLGLRAARAHFVFLAADMKDVFTAHARVAAASGSGRMLAASNDDLDCDEVLDLATTVDEAWFAAASAAGYDPEVQHVRGALRLVERELDGDAAVRDLFESVS